MKVVSSQPAEDISQDQDRVETQLGKTLTPPLGLKDLQRLRKLIAEVSSIVNGENVSRMPPNPNMTAFEALLVTICENPPNVVILYEEDGKDLYIRSSKLNTADVVYLMEKGKLQVMGLID